MGADVLKTKLKLSLERNETNGLETPLEYELQITNMEVSNTYVFTEKDMPGFETSSTSTGKPGDPPIPARLLYQNRKPDSSSSTGAPAKPDWKNKNAAGGANGQRYSPYVRKTIPKKTAIVGTARHEITMIPVYNEEYRKFQHKKQLLEEAPKYSTKFLDTQLKPNLLGAGTAGGMAGGKKFESFIVSHPLSLSQIFSPSPPLRPTLTLTTENG